MTPDIERLLGPELKRFYRIFVYPYAYEPGHLQLRLSPDEARSQSREAFFELDIRGFEAIQRALDALQVSGFSRYIGELGGAPVSETILVETLAIMERIKREDFHFSQGITLIALNTDPQSMRRRIDTLNGVPGITERRAPGDAA